MWAHLQIHQKKNTYKMLKSITQTNISNLKKITVNV